MFGVSYYSTSISMYDVHSMQIFYAQNTQMASSTACVKMSVI